MNNLQQLLVILDGQKLKPGYLSPAGTGTALETVIALMNGFNRFVLFQNPIPIPALLFTPAWIASLGAGQDAIFLDGVDGSLDLSKAAKQPAYLFF
jgi:hypothetical protein